MLEILLQGMILSSRAGDVSLIAIWSNSLPLTYGTMKYYSFVGVMQDVTPDVFSTEAIF